MGKQRDCNRSMVTLPGGGTQRMCCLLMIVFVVFLPSNAFQTTQKKQSTQTHQMIGNVFGGGGGSSEPQLPSDVKDAISKCRGAVQKGLEDRISRMVSEHMYWCILKSNTKLFHTYRILKCQSVPILV